ncbi:MAG: hypothetical protein JWN86_393 [Planctomycetota bacterium]|nr:hypothetical protein [Planctomycetota bacterium]
MGWLRFSVAGLMALVLAASLGFAALRFAFEPTSGIVLLLTLGVLALSVLSIAYRRKDARAFWLGFALLGWGYMLLSGESWWPSPGGTTLVVSRGMGSGVRGGDEEPHNVLITTRFLDTVRPLLQANPNAKAAGTGFSSFFLGLDHRSRKIEAKLGGMVSMPFPNEIPLEEVLKYIRNATADVNFPGGIPVYVDPIGLAEAEKTMASPIVLNLEGVPLRRSLKLLLAQLDLTYFVEDGLLKITSPNFQTNGSQGEAADAFRRVGHCYFALLAACLGGFAGRILYATRDRAPEPSAS